jgi:hypothetical protein
MASSQPIGRNYSSSWGDELDVDEQGAERGSSACCRADSEDPEPASRRADAEQSAAASTEKPTETNGQRTSAREPRPYLESTTTSSGDSIYAAGAAIKGRESNGIEVEVFTASAQIGGQFETQVGAARIGTSSDDGTNSIAMDVFTARAAMGVHNADGSFGWNVGATATAIGAEGTVQLGSASSLTAGASVGVGLEGSVGFRDADGDKQPELCGRVVAQWATFGLCVESPFEVPALSPPHPTGGR